MFSFAVMTKGSILFVRTFVYHMPRFITPKAYNFLRAFLRMVLRWKTIIAWVFIQTSIIVMTRLLAPETFNVFCEISWNKNKITDKLPFMYLQKVFGYLFLTEAAHHKLLQMTDLLVFYSIGLLANFFAWPKVFEASYYFVFF